MDIKLKFENISFSLYVYFNAIELLKIEKTNPCYIMLYLVIMRVQKIKYL